ncbi:MAG: hypothetical protein Q9159_003223 [Coniocarpon cinnabarinum]
MDDDLPPNLATVRDTFLNAIMARLNAHNREEQRERRPVGVFHIEWWFHALEVNLHVPLSQQRMPALITRDAVYYSDLAGSYRNRIKLLLTSIIGAIAALEGLEAAGGHVILTIHHWLAELMAIVEGQHEQVHV